jgi:hypothetical protein
MTDEAEDLRATIDDIVTDAARLKAIEERKRDLGADDAALAVLAAEARQIADDLPAKAEAQSMLVERLAEGDASDA